MFDMYEFNFNSFGPDDAYAHIAKTLVSISIRYRSDAKVSDRYLIEVDPSFSAGWCFANSIDVFIIKIKGHLIFIMGIFILEKIFIMQPRVFIG